MVRQKSYEEKGVTARIELIGADQLSVSEEDLDFMANLLMAMALSSRRDINEARYNIVQAVQWMARG